MIKSIIGVALVAWITLKIANYRGDHDLSSVDLRGKNVLLTGASSGIGEEMAYIYAKHGANVFISARRKDRLKEVVKKCASLAPHGSRFAYFPGDMEEEEDRVTLVEKAAEFFDKKLDQLMLNHALMPMGRRWQGNHDDSVQLRRYLEINTVAYSDLAGLAYRYLLTNNGSIGIVSSGAGHLPVPYMNEYASSKFAQDGYFSSLRLEFLNRNIPISITLAFLGSIETEAGEKSFKAIMDAFSNPSKIAANFYHPTGAEDTASAVISTTTRRVPQLYYPKSQLLWPIAVIRQLFPGIIEYFMLMT